MREALTASKLPLGPIAVAPLSVALAYALASPAQTETVEALAVTLAVVLALWLPPHLFLAGSLAVFGTYQVYSTHPVVVVGGISLYASDLLVALVVVRALAARSRRSVPWRVLDGPTALALSVWALVMVAAAFRGYLSGTPVQSLVRLDSPVLFYPILAWGFTRVLRENGVSSTRVVKALAATALAFVGYMAFERLTHHRFETGDVGLHVGDQTLHLGPVVTAQGITLHRDYGFVSAYDLYGLAALAATAHLMYARRSRGVIVAVAGIFVAASAMTLWRGIVFGLIVGMVLLVMLAWRPGLRNHFQGLRLIMLAVVLALAMVFFWATSPTTARGVTERFLPGVAAQSQSAVQTARFRQQALSFGYHQASTHPLGTGLVLIDSSSSQGVTEILYVVHSAWARMLVYTGWLGLVAFLWAVFVLIRRSSRLPDGPGWLKPFFLAAVALLVVEAFGSAAIVLPTWVLGEAALLIGLRFGLADLDD